jgi:uncharacterized repeat protein (TIGR03803 family)
MYSLDLLNRADNLVLLPLLTNGTPLVRNEFCSGPMKKSLHNSSTWFVCLTAFLSLAIGLNAGPVFYNLPAGLKNPRGLAAGTDGNLYGTTQLGGASGSGTVFKMTPGGKFTVLASFGSPNGERPSASLAVAQNGDMYGVTENGGAYGYGTVFKVTQSGTLTTLVSFDDALLGGYPNCKLLYGYPGAFYGSTSDSSLAPPGQQNGTIFTIATDGTFSNYGYHGQATGFAWGDNALYGVNESSQAFQIDLDGNYTVIGTLPGPPMGCALMHAGDGMIIYFTNGFSGFYGTTYSGGSHGTGCIYSLTQEGDVSIVRSFDAESAGIGTPNTTGARPQGSLIQGFDGYLYGSTHSGGTNGHGNVYALAPDLHIVPIYSFLTTNGSASLLQANDGWIYGAVTEGGLSDGGRILKLKPLGATCLQLSSGVYEGLFAATNETGDSVVDWGSAGDLHHFVVVPNGKFHGQVLLAGTVTTISGAFDNNGHANVKITNSVGTVVVFDMNLAFGTITGTVSEQTGAWTAALRAVRGFTHPGVASYTLTIPPADASGATSPPGSGWAVFRNGNGNVLFLMTLADGTAVHGLAGRVSVNGDVPVYVDLYKGKGLLQGWINVGTGTPTGSLSWIQTAGVSSAYPNGFTNRNLQISGSSWVPPAPLTSPLPVTGATLTISNSVTGLMTFTVNGTTTNNNCLQVTASDVANKLVASVGRADGRITLRVQPNNILMATGVVLQNANSAAGLTTKPLGSTGIFTLTP